jgi:N-acetylglutamate synthase-like GNAT family acetyltransferase
MSCPEAVGVQQSAPVGPLAAVPADIPTIASLLRNSAPGCIPLSAETICRHLHRFAVFRWGGQVVATASIRPLEDGRLELRSVAVHEDFGGMGLATRLVRWAIDQARRLSKALFCVTRERAFFEKLGFAPVATAQTPPGILARTAATVSRSVLQHNATRESRDGPPAARASA